MRKLILLPCVALLTAVSANAAPPALTNQVASTDSQQGVTAAGGGAKAAAPEAAEEKKICKQLDTTGSRLQRRACLTAKEWKQVQDDLDH